MYRKRIFIFDMDGTLVDSSTLIQNTILEYLGDDSESIKHTVRDRYKESWYKILRDLKGSVDKARYWSLYEKNFSRDLKYFPEIASVLSELTNKGHLLAIFSSMKKKYVRKIASTFKAPFERIIAYEDPFKKKPDPEAILDILRTCRTVSGDFVNSAIYVGDTDKDISTGKNAKIETGLAEWGLNDIEISSILEIITPDYLFRNPRDMLDI